MWCVSGITTFCIMIPIKATPEDITRNSHRDVSFTRQPSLMKAVPYIVEHMENTAMKGRGMRCRRQQMKNLCNPLKNGRRCDIIYSDNRKPDKGGVCMIKIKNHLGTIGISTGYLRQLISATAESCFGVAGLNAYGAKQGV